MTRAFPSGRHSLPTPKVRSTVGNLWVETWRQQRITTFVSLPCTVWASRGNREGGFGLGCYCGMRNATLALGFGKRFTRNASIISALAFGPSVTQPRPREPEPATNLVHASAPSRPHVSLCSFLLFPRPLLLDLYSTTSFCGIFSDDLLKVVCSRDCVHSFF